MVGGSELNVDRDVLIAKFDSRGKMLWVKTAGSTFWESLENAVEAHDGGFVATGDLRHSFSSLSAVIMKFDSDGNLEWGLEMGGSVANEARSITTTSDGGYLISGVVKSEGPGGEDILLLKLSSNGSQQWSKILGLSQNEKPITIIETNQADFLLCGYTHPTSGISKDILIMSLSSNGDVVWSRRIGSDSNTDTCKSVVSRQDGIYFLADSNSFSGMFSILLGKLTVNGNLEWMKQIQGIANTRASSLYSVNGELILAGQTTNIGAGSLDYLLLKSTVEGNVY